MKHYDLLKDKRRHVISYKKDVPPKQIIDNALEKALRTTSSKNNMFAYRINVYGPEQQEWKDLVEELLEIWKEKSYSTLGNLGSNFRKKIKKRWSEEFLPKHDYDETWDEIEEEYEV